MSRRAQPPCVWCGTPTPSEATFNGRTLPLCRTCIDRLDRARREPDRHGYMTRCLSRKFPAVESGPSDRRPRRDRRQRDTRRAPSSPGSARDGSAASTRDGRRRDRAPSLRSELAAAVRQVNAELARLPESRRPDLAPVDGLEAEVRAADETDDRGRGLAAIRAWRDHALHRVEQAAAGELR